MLFEYTRRRGARSPITDAATFKVGKLKQMTSREAQDIAARDIDFSHLIDTSYNYHSPRELRWHLAERLGVTPDAVAVRENA
ncbi:AsnC family transcriptional regulator [Methylobacterium marchantiae]|uniref:AsnC family transcriptional regulator n=1 Tax=Methylobacterium marchantiae TaxID=600331 RepID=A0ABW3WZL5_9HYPH|nr:hypothetical protein AIGOOFII_2257 [Methylobacterium marchantiae]